MILNELSERNRIDSLTGLTSRLWDNIQVSSSEQVKMLAEALSKDIKLDKNK
jgi:hypothetical protein